MPIQSHRDKSKVIMTSQVRNQDLTVLNGQVSVLAQAKPAIISPSFSTTKDSLDDKIGSLKLSRTNLEQHFASQLKVKHIEDDSVIQRQNASNQMRQAAVMAAVASQQKVRLSATERLALTAKKPAPLLSNLQSSLSGTHARLTNQQHGQQVGNQNEPPSKPAPMPTLETLLAVQRQLQQHTKQHLNSASRVSDTYVCDTTQNSSKNPQHSRKPLPPSPPTSPPTNLVNQSGDLISQADTYDKELPPLPEHSLSPSTSTDDSQLNSLESHQSSPATSLVSIPPPPPPISSYLEQYEDVNGCHASSSSSSSTSASSSSQSTTASPSLSSYEVSPVQHYPTQLKSAELSPNQLYQSQHNFKLPLPYGNHISSKFQHQYNSQHKSTDKQHNQQHHATFQQGFQLPAPAQFDTTSEKIETKLECNTSMHKFQAQPLKVKAHQMNQVQSRLVSLASSKPTYDIPPLAQEMTCGQASILSAHKQQETNKSTNNLPSTSFRPPPPPPILTSGLLPPPPPAVESFNNNMLSLVNDGSGSSGFDEPDSGNFRFPTPPPADLLLDEDDLQDEEEEEQVHQDQNNGAAAYGDEDGEADNLKKQDLIKGVTFESSDINSDHLDEDDEFQCKLPTLPPHKSMSAASFQNSSSYLQAKQSLSRIFSSSTFSPSSAVACATNVGPDQSWAPKPPALFRQQANLATEIQRLARTSPPLAQKQQQVQQQQANQQQQQQQQQQSEIQPAGARPPQLTVHINNHGGLLSTATDSAHHHHHLHRQMQAQAAANHHHNLQQHHHHMMMSMTTSSSSPSSSSDGDGQSTNSSSSTSGIHSCTDSPSSSNSKLDDFNYTGGATRGVNNGKQHQPKKQQPTTAGQVMHSITRTAVESPLPRTSSVSSNASKTAMAPSVLPPPPPTIRPALKQKKTVSFSDKVELVACADEQCDDHLPNPLLARVLAGKLQ